MKQWFSVLLVALITCGVGGAALAQGITLEAPKSSPAYATTVDYLVKFGTDNKDPQALLTAARLLNKENVPVTAVPRDRSIDPAKSETYQATRLLDQAEVFALGNASLLAEITKERSNVSKSRGGCYWWWRCDFWGNCWYQWVCF